MTDTENGQPSPDEYEAFAAMTPEQRAAHLARLRAEAQDFEDHADALKSWGRARVIVPLR